MSQRATEMRETWNDSFAAQIESGAYNTSPVEAVVRTVAYYLRARFAPEQQKQLHFLDLGCGAGPNMVWLAEKGITVSGLDIAPSALALARQTLEQRGLTDRLGTLKDGSVSDLPYADATYDGAVEACVFQHLDRADRHRSFEELARVLKPGGVFVGYMLSDAHTIFEQKRDEQHSDDPGTVILREPGANASRFHLGNIGLSHFFSRTELEDLLSGFSTVDICANGYDLPREEAQRRGYAHYHQGMWIVYAVK